MTEFVLPGTEVAIRTFDQYPGFTFHKRVAGYAYARNGHSKPGMQGHGTPRYTWTVRRDGKPVASGTTLKYVQEIVDIVIADGEA